MATSKALPIPTSHNSLLDADRHDLLGLTLSAALPVAVFIIAHGIGQLSGVLPLFFAPFGLPGWVGAALHIACLPLFGAARWMVADRGRRGEVAGWWIVALMAGVIAFPFVVAPLDSILLSMVSMLLLIVGIAASIRTAAVSRQAGWLMVPGLAWLGLSAFIGLGFAAAWTPPFAVANSNAAVI